MDTNLQSHITDCVTKGITFEGKIGTSYTVQDLFHVVKLETIDDMHTKAKKALSALGSDSLFKNKDTGKQKLLQLQIDTLAAVFAYRVEQDKKAREAKITREKNIARLAVLKGLQSDADMEKLRNMSDEDREAEILKLEASL